MTYFVLMCYGHSISSPLTDFTYKDHPAISPYYCYSTTTTTTISICISIQGLKWVGTHGNALPRPAISAIWHS